MKRCRLIYRSIGTPEALTPEGLEGILQQARGNNARLGIDGMLLVTGQEFLQVLEGPPKFVNEVFARIVADPRHQSVQLITYETPNTPFFHDWNMEILDLGTLPEAERAAFTRKYAVSEGHVEVPEDLLHVYGLLLDAQTLLRQRA